MIKNLTPQLAERGKIKIGGLGEERKKKGKDETYRLPEKYDHFVITTMQRDSAGRMIPDKALMDQVKEKTGTTGKLTEIPVRLLYDDIELNFQSRLSCYVGNRCWCSGDGEFAQRLGQGRVEDEKDPGKYREAKANEYGTVPCPCERLEATFSADKGRCKPMGTLQVLLEGIDRVGGVWKLRTTSWNTVKAVLSSLSLIKTITGGPLARIPLCLVISPKTVTVPGTGQSQVVFVVSLEYRGSEEELAEVGYGIAKRRMEHQVRMDSIELQAQKLLVAPHEEQPQEQEETAKEFFHEAADAVEPAPPETSPSESSKAGQKEEPEQPPTNTNTAEPEPHEGTQEILLETNVLPSLAFSILKEHKVKARIEKDGKIFYAAKDEALVKEIFPGDGNKVEPAAPSEEEIVACPHCGYEFPGGDICPNCELPQDGGPPSKAGQEEEKKGERPRLF